ncbi:MAG: hypothetical protein PUE18_05945 [Firmicutes bacterium]|nr:hypothetical protein [Bacillota bacterium]
MAGKKLPKNVDFAAGFFSNPAPEENKTEKSSLEKITPPAKVKIEPDRKDVETSKNRGGRPKKDGLKNEQFTLTMNPETYEKLRIIAADRARGNFSLLIDEAIKSYCKEYSIDLSEITVDPAILEMYKRKQESKANKKNKSI